MCEEVVEVDPWFLVFVPDHLKGQEMCNETVRRDPDTLRYLSDCLKTQ